MKGRNRKALNAVELRITGAPAGCLGNCSFWYFDVGELSRWSWMLAGGEKHLFVTTDTKGDGARCSSPPMCCLHPGWITESLPEQELILQTVHVVLPIVINNVIRREHNG